MKNYVCIQDYDPCFGFKILKSKDNYTYSILNWSDPIASIFDDQDRLVGTIYTSDIPKHFREIV